MRLPLFRTVYINNIVSGSKKPATISVRLTRSKEDLFYVKKVQSSTEVIGYKDPNSGLFMTKLRNDDTKSNLVHNMFRDMAWRYAQEQVTLKLEELAEMYEADSENYKTMYKPLNKIESELNEYLSDKHEFFVDLDKQISVFKSNTKPHTNEFVLYKDDEVTNDMFATIRMNYLNPTRQMLTDEDSKLVEQFLDVFLDDYNKQVLSWYFGAMLSNLPIYDERISKMMVVSSARGGSGKNTLINSLTNALLTDAYREIKSSFDVFYMLNNRFGTSQIIPLRLIQYSEAEFNDSPQGSHNFDGLNISEIKSMISEGYVSSEKKYDDMQTTRLSSMHVVLTNNPPTIDVDRGALNRRILALIIKPSLMDEKGDLLGMDTEQKVYEFVEDNVQAFANYFVSKFNDNQYAFTQLDYNHSETVEDIADGEYARMKQAGQDRKELTSSKDVTEVLSSLAERKNIDIELLIKDIIKSRKTNDNPDIRWDGTTLYLNSKKDFMLSYGPILPLRNVLKSVYGDPIKKYGQRMYKLTAE